MSVTKNSVLLKLEIALIAVVYFFPIALGFIDIGDNIFSGPFNRRDGSIYWALLVGGIFSLFIFYLNVFYLIPTFLSQRKFLQYWSWILIMLLGSSGLEYGFEEWLKTAYSLPENLPQLYPEVMRERRDIGAPAFVINLFILGLSFIYRFTKDWMRHESDKRMLRQEKQNAELRFLHSQVNPHFLFNTLNNIYAIARRHQDLETSDAIEKLSTIMRFMLYESSANIITIEQEVEHIQSMIEIQQLRVGEGELVVNFTKRGGTDGVTIAPMVLIPFVENAFKHGIDPKKTSIIKIELDVGDLQLTFRVKNKKTTITDTVPGEPSGIGLENVRKRLALIYPQKHTMNIIEDEDNFEVVLTIDLS